MTDIIVIPRSNVLSFVKDNADLPTLDNRLLQDDIKGWRTELQYFTKFDTSDSINFQFITNRAESKLEFELYTYDQELVASYSLAKVLDIDDFVKVYQTSIPCVTYEGKCYVKLSIDTDNGYPAQVYYSNYIEIGVFNDGVIYSKLEWSGSVNDGIYYADENPITFMCRLPINLQDVTTKTDATVYTAYDNSTYNLHSQKKRVINCVIDPVPMYFALILDLAFSHETVLVNGQSFVATEAGSKMSQFPKTNMYELVISLVDNNYENYYNLLDTGNSITVSTDGLAINDDDVLLINETDILEI